LTILLVKKALDTLSQLPYPKAQLPTADRRLRIPSHHIHNFQEQDQLPDPQSRQKRNKNPATNKPYGQSIA